MDVRALIAATDHNTASLIRRSLNSVSVNPEESVNIDDVLARVRRQRYEAIVVDLSVDGGRELLGSLRSDPSTRASLLFALASGKTSMREAFQLGATFVLEKPLSLDRTQRCFRAAYGLIVGERRRYYRHVITMPVTVFRSGGEQAQGSTVDLSAGGLLLQISTPLPEDSQVKIHFGLPGSTDKIAIAGQVIWNKDGRAGLRFLRYSKESKELLTNWLGVQMEREMGDAGSFTSRSSSN